MRNHHWILFPAMLATLLLALGCTPDDDDDSADDDDGPDPNAPVISNLDVDHYAVGEKCNALVEFHVDDADGDLDGSVIKVKFDDSEHGLTLSVDGIPPFNSLDLSVEFQVGGVLTEKDLDHDTEYDIEVWMFDLAMLESNHLTELDWTSPDENCF